MPDAGARWNQRYGVRVLAVAFSLLGVLLFVPIFRYSLDTPFALIDDYSDWKYSVIFTSPSLFREWLDYNFLDTESLRYRPFWEFYNAISWSIFGTNAWLHHLSRWGFHFAMVALFSTSLLCFVRWEKEHGTDKTWMIPLIPLTFLVSILLFFPNIPASRLSPQEVYTSFFLGLCTLAVALTLSNIRNRRWIHSPGWRYGLFILGYAGVLSSKEPNVGAGLWLLLAYTVWAIVGTGRRRKLMGGIPLTLIFGFTIYRLVGSAGTYENTLGSSFERAERSLVSLFQTETSILITVVFSLLFLIAIASTIVSVIRRHYSKESLFILFLVGQILSLFLSISLFSPIYALRYWFPVLPVFTMVMAFAVNYLVFQSRKVSWVLSITVGSTLLIFCAFFIAINYYNFSLQITSQHRARNIESSTINAVARLLDNGEYVYSLFIGNNEYDYSQLNYFDQYLPFFGGEHTDISWVGWPSVATFSPLIQTISLPPPREFASHSFLVDYYGPEVERGRLDFLDVHATRWGMDEYRIFSFARDVAQFLQGGTLHTSIDAGAPVANYHSTIYRVPFGHHNDRIIDVLRAEYEQALSSDPAAQSFFDIHSSGDRLVYVREHCTPEDVDGTFVLHLTPVNTHDLPDDRKTAGFHNLDFHFQARGARFDERCVASVSLPDYAIASIEAGQYTEEGTVWSVEFIPGLVDSVREAWMLSASETPLAQSTFDLYLVNGSLIYVREQCAPTDTQALFFLHLTPVDAEELPEGRQPYGFDNLDFRFTVRGTSFDGRCVAAMPLPDYPIAGIRTGQYGDAGELWSVEFAPQR